MPAECYCCLTGKSKIPNPIVKSTTPAGVCYNCNILGCLNHGHRDNTIPAFTCVLCDPKLLVASASFTRSSSASPPAPGHLRLGPGFPNLFRRSRRLFRSRQDFEARRPGYRNWFEEISDSSIEYYTDSNNPYNNYFQKINNEGQYFLVAAAVITLHVYNRDFPDEVPEDLQFLAANLYTKNSTR